MVVGVIMELEIKNISAKVNALSFANNAICTLGTMKTLSEAEKNHQAMLSELMVDLFEIRDFMELNREALFNKLKDTM
jgi:hypothetical protein